MCIVAQLVECYLESKGRKFETDQRRGVVSLSMTLYFLLSRGSSQQDRNVSRYD